MVSSLAWSKKRIKRLPLERPSLVLGIVGAFPVPFGTAEGIAEMMDEEVSLSSSESDSDSDEELDST